MLVNGESVTCIAARDRGLQYGDGVFETLAVREGLPCLWSRHLWRLLEGCRRLGIDLPNPVQLYDEVINEIGDRPQGVIKLILTRGSGGRGYRPEATGEPSRIVNWSASPALSPSAAPQGIRARLCTTRLGSSPALAGIKHLNRLEQVLASSEWNDPAIEEGLMLDTDEHIIEGTRSNLFVILDGQIHTPALNRCGVAGIMRELVIELAQELDRPVIIGDIGLDRLWSAEALFVTNSLIGIQPIVALDEQAFSIDKIPQNLIQAVFDQGFRHECAPPL